MLMNIIKFLGCLVACFGAAYIGSTATMPSIPTWYAALNKPVFNPPNWIFGPVWSLLYLLMAISLYLVLGNGFSLAVVIFIVQLLLNIAWSIAFFGYHSPLTAFIIIIALWLAILLTIIKFYKISHLAGWLLIPYLLWVSFASILNLAVVILNR